jgi:hypothetical protein
MQGHWINEARYYRCRFPSEYALANKIRHPRNVYLREDAFEAEVNGWLTSVFAPHRLRDTIDQMMGDQQATGDQVAAARVAEDKIADANLKMARYRAAIDAGGDPGEIGTWIAEAKAQRVQAESDRRQATSTATMTRQQIHDLIEECAHNTAALGNADPADMASAYRELGLRLTYHPARNLVQAAACPPAGNIGKWSVSEERVTPKTNAYSPVNSQLGAGCDRGRGPMDPLDHHRMRRAARTDRGHRFLPAYAPSGGVAWAARLGGCAHASVGRRDDRGRVDHAAGRLTVGTGRWDAAVGAAGRGQCRQPGRQRGRGRAEPDRASHRRVAVVRAHRLI